jgi:hypothetical protein
VGAEEAGNVLQEDPTRSVSFHKPEEGEGEAGSLAGESSALSCDGEVLAGEAAGPEFSPMPLPIRNGSDNSSSFKTSRCTLSGTNEFHDFPEVRDTGPSLGEDGGGVGVDLGEADGAPSGSLESEIQAPDS